MKAVVMKSPGGVDALDLVDLPDPRPGPGQVLVDVAVAGVNFMDGGVRRGTLWADQPNPKILGVEGAGRVLALGEGVTHLRPGDRVAWAYAPGSYAQRASIPAHALVPVPDGIDDRTAAAVMLQGLTASHFATDFYPVQVGDHALIHAAAGGVGGLLTQIVKLRGGHVIGRVSTDTKVGPAREAGCDHVIVDAEGRFADRVLELTGGEGVNVVYDGSGPVTFKASLASLRYCGTFCWYGPALGSTMASRLMDLPKSIKIGYARFADHVHTPELLKTHARRLFDWILEGKLSIKIGGTYTLSEASQAQAALDARLTTGKLLLICD